MEDIVIVGGGQAGGCAAAALRQSGYTGRLVLIGDEKHPPYERPPLSKELLSGVVPPEKTYLQPTSWYTDAKVDLLLGVRVEKIDRTAKTLCLSTGATIPYGALLMTMGARARQLARVPPSSSVFYLRTIEEALALNLACDRGKRIAVIGAGFIGLEVAATARKQGCHVVVFETAKHVLARVAPRVVADYVQQLHEQNGIQFEFGCAITNVQAGAPSAVLLGDGRRFEVDLIVVGIGAQPNVEIAIEAGLTVDDGVVVDEFGRTNDPAIFAAGDVTKHFNPLLGRAIRLEAWQNAQNQAIAVAKVMAGGNDPFAEVPWLWTDQFDMNMQIAGAPLDNDSIVVRGDVNARSFTVFQMSGTKLVGAIAVNAAKDMRFVRRMLAKISDFDATALADSNVSLQDLSR